MIYSKTCEYAIRALSYLSSGKGERFCLIPEISRATGVPHFYIAKIFQGLVRAGILKSRRGPSGGFAFERDPASVSLFEIVQAVDDISLLADACVMGLDQCSAVNACPLHAVWEEARKNVLASLRKTVITKVRKKMGRLEFRGLDRCRLKATAELKGVS